MNLKRSHASVLIGVILCLIWLYISVKYDESSFSNIYKSYLRLQFPKKIMRKQEILQWNVTIAQRHGAIRKACRRFLNANPIFKNIELTREPNSRLAYCRNAKAATTTWLLSLMKLSKHTVDNNTAANIHDVASSVLANSKTDKTPNYIKITCVRHPYTRIVSAYLDKIVANNYMNISSRLVAKRDEFTNLEHWSEVSIPLGININSIATFEEFIDDVIDSISSCKEQERSKHCLSQVDVHWQPQSERCNPCYGSFDLILKTETLANDFAYLKNLLVEKGLPESSLEDLSYKIHSSNMDTEAVTKILFSRLQDTKIYKLREIYKNDFLLFNYDPTIY